MKTIAALALFTLASATTVKRAPEGIDDTVILNYALTLEHLENAFYSEALSKYDDKAFTDAGLPSGARALFQQVAAHEQAHVNFLSTALGANATMPCTYKFPYTDPKSFAAVSQILEGVGVSAYAGAAQYITNPAYLTAAAVVLSTEARHASWVAAAVNDVQPWSGPLDVPLTLNEVYSLAAAFITSCPTTNPALPVKAFPTLTVTPATGVKPGDTITIAFDGLADGMTAVFLTGLSPVSAPVTGGKVTVPKDLTGTVYLVITKSGDSVTDDTTSAGPAIFQFQEAIASSGGSGSSGSTSSAQSSGMDNGVESNAVSLLLLAVISATVMSAML